jgi:hypothetical protein
MRQNPKWILLSEVRSAEAVLAVRNSISSGHNILSTIHSDKASAIPFRLYSLMESNVDLGQFLNTIYRYIQLGVHIKAFYSPKYGKFHREIDEVTEFYVDDENNNISNTIYHKIGDKIIKKAPSEHLMNYLLGQNIKLDTKIVDEEGSAAEIMANNNASGLEMQMVTEGNAPALTSNAPLEYKDNNQTVKSNVVTTPVVNNTTQVVTNNVATTPVVNNPTQVVPNNNVVSSPQVAPTNNQVETLTQSNVYVSPKVDVPVLDSGPQTVTELF